MKAGFFIHILRLEIIQRVMDIMKLLVLFLVKRNVNIPKNALHLVRLDTKNGGDTRKLIDS